MARARTPPPRRLSICESPSVDVNEEIVELRNRLRPEHKRALRQSWARLKGHTGLRKVVELFFNVFNQVIDSNSGGVMFTQAAFVHALKNESRGVTTIHDHAQFFAKFLEYFIDPRSNFSRNSKNFSLSYLGRCHTELVDSGFQGQLFERFGQTVSETLSVQSNVRSVPHAAKAWMLLCATLTDAMRASFEKCVREKRKHKIALLTKSAPLDSPDDIITSEDNYWTPESSETSGPDDPEALDDDWSESEQEEEPEPQRSVVVSSNRRPSRQLPPTPDIAQPRPRLTTWASPAQYPSHNLAVPYSGHYLAPPQLRPRGNSWAPVSSHAEDDEELPVRKISVNIPPTSSEKNLSSTATQTSDHEEIPETRSQATSPWNPEPARKSSPRKKSFLSFLRPRLKTWTPNSGQELQPPKNIRERGRTVSEGPPLENFYNKMESLMVQLVPLKEHSNPNPPLSPPKRRPFRRQSELSEESIDFSVRHRFQSLASKRDLHLDMRPRGSSTASQPNKFPGRVLPALPQASRPRGRSWVSNRDLVDHSEGQQHHQYNHNSIVRTPTFMFTDEYDIERHFTDSPPPPSFWGRDPLMSTASESELRFEYEQCLRNQSFIRYSTDSIPTEAELRRQPRRRLPNVPPPVQNYLSVPEDRFRRSSLPVSPVPQHYW